MTDVVPYRRERSWLSLQNPALELANAIAGTDFVPSNLRNNPAAICAAILYGDEIGIGPMMSLAKIAVINGRPTLAAEAQRALILAAGHDLWIEESTVSRCIICGRRKDSEATSRISWSLDDAKRANLAGKQAWRLYPRQMLLARASAELARAVFPDAIGGLAATEELDDNPELAQTGNGPEPAKPISRRRRRASVTATPAAQEGQPDPPVTAAAPPEAGGLPPDEQAIVDALTAELGVTPAEDEPDLISETQRRKLHAMFRDHDIDDRAQRLNYCALVIGRQIQTSTDLTKDEASAVIDHLDRYDTDDPKTWPGTPPGAHLERVVTRLHLDALEEYEAQASFTEPREEDTTTNADDE